MGVILERVSGKSYEELLQQNICNTLRMENTRITLGPSDSSKFAQGYNFKPQPVFSWEFQSLAAAGGIRSTVNDMLLYAKAQTGNNITALDKAIALTHKESFESGMQKVGLGWHVAKAGEKNYLAHNGQTGGYCSVMVFNRDAKTAVVILTNASVDPALVSFELMNALLKN